MLKSLWADSVGGADEGAAGAGAKCALAEVERSEVPTVLQRIRQQISFTVQRATAEGFLMREETFSAPDSLGGFGAGEANGAHRRGEQGQRGRRANSEVEAPLAAVVAITMAPNTEDVVCTSANEVRVFSGDALGGEICIRGGGAAKDIELADCFCSVVHNEPAPSIHPRLWGRGGYGQSARTVEGVDGRAAGIMGVELQQDLLSGLAGEGVKDEEAADASGCRNL